jgi:hypothetical protein
LFRVPLRGDLLGCFALLEGEDELGGPLHEAPGGGDALRVGVVEVAVAFEVGSDEVVGYSEVDVPLSQVSGCSYVCAQ